LVESAVNDQCRFHEQVAAEERVNRTSNKLLNILTNFPSKPAVFSIELFRTAYNNKRDANRECQNHIKVLTDPVLNQPCFSCEQWWMPQDWRVSARERNSVSYISYRDAVWPDQHHPPNELCQYWSGMSHPKAGVHSMVASTILFTFLLVDHKKGTMVQRFRDLEQRIQIEPPSLDLGICLQPVSSFRAGQGNPIDPMNMSTTNRNKSSCWEFKADSKEKYGWICETSRTSMSTHSSDFHVSQKNIAIGMQTLVIVSRLVSYDERMATAQIWFSAVNSSNASNAFVDDPVWNVTSFHSEKTSIPKQYSISLDTLELKTSSGLQWEGRLELLFNIKVLIGSSKSNIRVDKFKLLGIVSC
jgi:hypothetical protein